MVCANATTNVATNVSIVQPSFCLRGARPVPTGSPAPELIVADLCAKVEIDGQGHCHGASDA